MLISETQEENAFVFNDNESRYERGGHQLTLPPEVKMLNKSGVLEYVDNCLCSLGAGVSWTTKPGDW